jgi:hypothetical protein
MIVEPVAGSSLSPTATQTFELAHEIAVTSTAFDGTDWFVQLEPLFNVPTAYGDELKSVPTAMQFVALGHATEARRDPTGIELVPVHDVIVPLTVLSDVAPPPNAIPTATHVVAREHDTAVKRFTDG